MTEGGADPTVLVVDDESPFREDIARILRDEGLECKTAESGEECLDLAQSSPPDVVLCDIVMPGMSGVDTLERLQELCPETGVFMVTAYGNLDTALEAFRQGAYDYLTKPVNPEEVVQKIDRYLDFRKLSNEVDRLRREVSRVGANEGSHPGYHDMVGESPPMKKVYQLIEQALSEDSNTLITGETGTGKELAARAIHEEGHEEDDPFVAVNCSALSESLFESELFGYAEGAFTGATRDKAGYFEEANGGTLFLDEISEMSTDLQAKLLRAIERKEIQRVGETKTRPVDIRVIASSNQDLEKSIEEGHFREDLYYRLNVLHLTLPPLRERREDIPLLVDYFIDRYNYEMNQDVLGAENAAMQNLMTYSWPGNVRELENIVERWMIVHSEGELLTQDELPNEIKGEKDDEDELTDNLQQALEAYEKQHIRKILNLTDGNRTKTAEQLGIDPSTLYRKMDKYNLDE